jgi:P4 family phage/plasmid primase-like protien
MNAPYGKYCIDGLDYDNFLILYQKAIENGEKLSIIERQLDIGPIVIDIDIRQKEKERQYTLSTIRSIMNLYIKLILKYLKIESIQVCILEKEKPTYDEQKKNYKDGFHIIIPDIPIHYSMRYFLYDTVKKSIEHIFKDINYLNSIDDLFDKSVVHSNGILMFGSSKDNKTYYKLTHIFNNETNLDDIVAYNNNDIIILLSLRRYNYEISAKEQINLDKYNINYKETIKTNIINKITTLTSTSSIKSIDIDYAKELTLILSPQRAADYHSWIHVGWTLHNISDSLYQSFIEFSKKCPTKYNLETCQKVWNNARNEGYTIASLCFWAKEDNCKEYTRITLARIDDIIKRAGSGTHDDIATMIYEIYKYTFKCVSIKNHKWFEFIKHRWVHRERGYTLQDKIANEVTKEFSIIAAKYFAEACNGADTEELTKKGQKMSQIIQNLKMIPFQENIMKACERKFYDDTFIKKLDSNPFLIGFENGIYDLKLECFRNGIPDDYIQLSVGYDYIEYNKNDLLIKDIYKYFEQVQTEIEMREYLLTFLATMCDGKQLQMFVVWTGTGANGKSTTQELIKKAFGDYYSIIPNTILTQKRVKSGSACPELADKAGKRATFVQETENNDPIFVGQMKELSGSDQIMARGLFTDPFYFVPQFQIVLVCNILPKISSNENGTWRRTRVLPWESEFVKEKPTKSNQFKMDTELTEKFESWKQPFMWLLLNIYYPRYKKEGLKEPAKVIEFTDKYKKNSDLYQEYIIEQTEIVDGSKETIISFYDHFKMWYKNVYSEKPPAKKEFVQELLNKGHKIVGTSIYNIRPIYSSKIDEL